MSTLIVGEQPNGTLGPHGPLVGGKFPEYAGITQQAFIAMPRANLFDTPCPHWCAAEARDHAAQLLDGHESFVLLGRRVATAFGVGHVGWLSSVRLNGHRFAVVPHPSGRSRVWNDPAFRARARAFLRLWI